MRAVVEEPPRPVRLAGPLTPILWGLLEKDPARRWTVNQARGVLRELMAGPLSRSGTTHPDTDPYAVVRPPAAPPPAVVPPEQIGGRAMIAPGESLTGHLARLNDGSVSPATAPGQGNPAPRHGAPPPPHGAPPHGGPPHGAPPPGPGAPPFGQPRGAGGHGPGPMGQPHPDSTGGWNDRADGGAPWTEEAAPPPGRRSAGRRRAQRPSMMGDIAGGARSLGRRVRQAPTRVRIAAAAGIVVALAVAGTIVLTGAFSGPDGAGAAPGPTPGASASAKTPPLYAGAKKSSWRGITVNVPGGWKKTEGGTKDKPTYVDFVDPDGGATARKIRINVEAAGGSAEAFFKVAEGKLKTNATNCPAYQRVGLRDTTLGGRGGSELEYTCGEGDEQRHGLWSAVVEGGKAYHFFLTVPESDLADSKVIYQELIRSFTLTTS
jgi:hypothetical protein